MAGRLGPKPVSKKKIGELHRILGRVPKKISINQMAVKWVECRLNQKNLDQSGGSRMGIYTFGRVPIQPKKLPSIGYIGPGQEVAVKLRLGTQSWKLKRERRKTKRL